MRALTGNQVEAEPPLTHLKDPFLPAVAVVLQHAEVVLLLNKAEEQRCQQGGTEEEVKFPVMVLGFPVAVDTALLFFLKSVFLKPNQQAEQLLQLKQLRQTKGPVVSQDLDLDPAGPHSCTLIMWS